MTNWAAPEPVLADGVGRRGGTGDIRGSGNITFTDSQGPVSINAFGLDDVKRLVDLVPRRRPVSADRLDRIEQRFVPPTGSGFAAARLRLAKPSTAVISGEPGSGRHTAGLMLLHKSGDGASSFQELAVLDGKVKPEAHTIQEHERLLLDLTDFGHRQLVEVKAEVEQFRAEVEQRAFLVVVVAAAHRGAWGSDFGPELSIGFPDRLTVLRRHLEDHEVELPRDVWSMPELGEHLTAGHMRDLADLAQQVRAARDRQVVGAGPRDWVVAAVGALADQRAAVRDQLSDLDGRARALVFTTAMMQGASMDEVFHAERLLLHAVDYPKIDAHSLDDKDIGLRLEEIHAGIGLDGVRIDKPGLDRALRNHFWRTLPGLRPAFTQWVHAVVAAPEVSSLHKHLLVERFAEQTLAVGEVGHVIDLVEEWTRDERSVASLVLVDALLHRGLAHERHGQEFRRRFYDWAIQRSLPTLLAHLVITLSQDVIAPTHADQAVVRLRWLTGHRRGEVRAAALTALSQLATDPLFWRRILHRICLYPDGARLRDHDRELFTRLVATEALPGWWGTLSHRQVRDHLTVGWRRLLAAPLDSTTAVVEQWLGSGRAVLLDILVAAAAPDTSLLGDLYGVGRRWQQAGRAAERPARDAVIGELRTAIDRAQGLRFLDPEVRPEGIGR